jgi:hypothetical protein
MASPVWSADVCSYGDVGILFEHHKSLALTDLLRTRSMITGDLVNLAIPRMMASDAYLIADRLFRGSSVPRTVIYGIAPRDFMDDRVSSAASTLIFERLIRLEDLFGLAALYLPRWEDRIDLAVNRLFPIYGKRQQHQERTARLIDGTAGPSAKAGAGKSEANLLLPENRQLAWQRSIEEYRKRYRRFNERQFEMQCQFLERLLRLGQLRNFRVVLVNMPLTGANLALMPEGKYDSYLTRMKEIANRNASTLIDLQESRFEDPDFYDTVHLNGVGGRKLLGRLATWLEAEREERRIAAGGAFGTR